MSAQGAVARGGALVVGAETSLGAALAARLLRVDGRAAALCATPEAAAPLRARGVEVFVGDACDPEAVTLALHGRAELYLALSDPPPPPAPPPTPPRPLWGWRGAQEAVGALTRALAIEVGLARPRSLPPLAAERPAPPPEEARALRATRAALLAAERLRALGAPLRCALLCGDLALAPARGAELLEPTSPLCAEGRGAALAAALQLAERALWTSVVHGVPYLEPTALPPLRGAAASLVQLDDLVTGLLLLRAHDRALDPSGWAGSGRWVLGGENVTPRALPRALFAREEPARSEGREREGEEEERRPLSSRRAVERLGYRWRPLSDAPGG